MFIPDDKTFGVIFRSGILIYIRSMIHVIIGYFGIVGID